MACWAPCAEFGPFKFAGLAGVVFDIAGCGAICTAMCACNVAIPGVCYARDTTFASASSLVSGIRYVQDLRVGEPVWTLLNGELTATNVTQAMEILGSVAAVRLSLQSSGSSTTAESTELVVTENHGLLLAGQIHKPLEAKHVQVGDAMLGSYGRVWSVTSVQFITLDSRFMVQTATKTVLASGVLTTTSCLH